MKKIKLLFTTLFLASFMFAAFAQKSPKPVYRLGGFWDHWFISAGVGGQMYFGEDDNKVKIGDRITPSFQLSAGKWVTHFLGARVQVGGMKLKGWNDGIGGEYREKGNHAFVIEDPQINNPDRKWTKPRKYDPLSEGGGSTLMHWDPEYWGGKGGVGGSVYAQELDYIDAHLDVMFNITSAIMGYKPNRVFNLIPYAGVGWAHVFGDDYIVSDDAFIPVAGIMTNFRISDAIDLGLDIKGTIVPEAFDSHVGGENSKNWTQEGYVSASLGVTYKFKQREFEVVYEMDPLEIQQLNDKINALYVPQTAPACPECPPALRKTRVFLAPVHFPLDVHLVQKKEMYKVELAAKYLREEPGRTLHLEGYADRQTGSPQYNQGISERRVREVRRLLIEKYGVDANRLTIGWQGDIKQPFDLNELNRAVLFVGDEDVLDEVRNPSSSSNRILPQPPARTGSTYQYQNTAVQQTPASQNVQPSSATNTPSYSGGIGATNNAVNNNTYNAPQARNQRNNAATVTQPASTPNTSVQSNSYYTPTTTPQVTTPQVDAQNRYAAPAQNTGRSTTKYIAPNSGVYQFNR